LVAAAISQIGPEIRSVEVAETPEDVDQEIQSVVGVILAQSLAGTADFAEDFVVGTGDSVGTGG
jgi:hypothetical protein